MSQMNEANRMGQIKWYDARKGFGFITNPEGKDVFFHYTALPGQDGRRKVFEGDMVVYQERLRAKDQRLHTPRIISVTRIQEQE